MGTERLANQTRTCQRHGLVQMNQILFLPTKAAFAAAIHSPSSSPCGQGLCLGDLVHYVLRGLQHIMCKPSKAHLLQACQGSRNKEIIESYKILTEQGLD